MTKVVSENYKFSSRQDKSYHHCHWAALNSSRWFPFKFFNSVQQQQLGNFCPIGRLSFKASGHLVCIVFLPQSLTQWWMLLGFSVTGFG